MQEEIEAYLAKAKGLHGDVCPGLLMGTVLGLAGMRALGLDPSRRNRDLIVFVEVDRCMTDAMQAVTGCSLGHRNLKYVDYGKFAAVLYDHASGRAVRVSPKQSGEAVGDVMEHWRSTPEDRLVELEKVEVEVMEDDLPGRPRSRLPCARCGETVMDNRGVDVGGKLLCRPCALGTRYYRSLPEDATGARRGVP